MLQSLQEKFQSLQNPILALKQKSYLRDLFPIFGITKPELKVALREVFKAHPVKTEKELHLLLLALWEQKEREFHYAALELAKKYKKLWTPLSFPIFEKMIRTHSWWDSVDDIASNLVGALFLKQPELIAHMDHWIEDSDLWIRRTAILYQLKWKDKTDEKRLFSYCQKRAFEKEFFIRKAIGWALRERSKTHPQSVLTFIEQNELSTLSRKEASVYLKDQCAL